MIYQKFLIYFFIFKYFILKIVKIGEINMKEKTKKFLQKYLIGFILGVISAGVIIVYAETYFPSNDVTYDNTKSGLSSTNVQGAIDELYGVCFPPKAGEQIIESAGLEKDLYECRYFFTGATPNNYITFNNETAGWRIISVECDGTIKIMRDKNIGKKEWNPSGSTSSNNWARPATLNTYLNSTYYNGLNATAQSQIVVKSFSTGKVKYEDTNLANTVNNENSVKWDGKVALPTVSEFIRTNSNRSSCGTFQLMNDNHSACSRAGWMFTTEEEWWTLSGQSGSFDEVYFIYSDRDFLLISPGICDEGIYNNFDNPEVAVRPTLYLSSDIKLSGSGTQSDPYIVS